MKICRSLEEAANGFAPAAISIGNFDGVHLGHRALFARLQELAPDLGAVPSVLTFDPHPARVLAPARAPRLLSTISQRLEWMAEAGIGQVLVLPFDRAFAALTPEQFAERVLARAVKARAVVVGANFRFGHKQGGDIGTLESLGREHGFRTSIVDAIRTRGRLVSSTEIRKLIEAGEVRAAGRLLGRCFALEGEVAAGAGIGSKQTVPTLNLAPVAEVLPAAGVYVTRTTDPDDGRQWTSVSNAGTRPTFDRHEFGIESFLLDPLSGPSPRRIRVQFQYRLRDERKFPDAASLKAQILLDAARARRYHARTAKLY
jgi:riboflavin kinase/FMN adenylyltransferase